MKTSARHIAGATLVVLALAMLLLFPALSARRAAMPGTAALVTATPTTFPQPPEIHFRGQALEQFVAPCCDQLSWWRVRVDEVLDGAQPCTTTLQVLYGSGFLPRRGSVDPSIQPGDRVEGYGYYTGDSATCAVDLLEARHYLRRAGAASAHLQVEPPAPSERDPVRITVHGQWGTGCPEVIHTWKRIDDAIYIVAGLANASQICPAHVTDWSFSEELGALPSQTYTVMVQAADLPADHWGFRDSLRFQVTSSLAESYLPWVHK